MTSCSNLDSNSSKKQIKTRKIASFQTKRNNSWARLFRWGRLLRWIVSYQKICKFSNRSTAHSKTAPEITTTRTFHLAKSWSREVSQKIFSMTHPSKKKTSKMIQQGSLRGWKNCASWARAPRDSPMEGYRNSVISDIMRHQIARTATPSDKSM